MVTGEKMNGKTNRYIRIPHPPIMMITLGGWYTIFLYYEAVIETAKTLVVFLAAH